MSASLEKSRSELRLNLAASSFTGGTTMLASNWLDCLRIRWQMARGDAATYGARSPQAFLVAVVRREGLWRGLWRHALLTNCLACVGSMGTRIGLYPYVRDLFGAKQGGGVGGGARMFAAGLAAGACGYATWYPLFMVKTTLHAEAGVLASDGMTLATGAGAGRAPTVRNGWEGLLRAWRGGGLYSGAAAFTTRGAILSGSQLATYDSTKTYLKGPAVGLAEGPLAHVLASLAASVGLTAAVMPLDTVFTAFQASKLQGGAADAGAMRTAQRLLREEGPGRFYRGSSAMFGRMLPTSVATFYIYEQVRCLLGMAYLD